jgi:hypothetical protein
VLSSFSGLSKLLKKEENLESSGGFFYQLKLNSVSQSLQHIKSFYSLMYDSSLQYL